MSHLPTVPPAQTSLWSGSLNLRYLGGVVASLGLLHAPRPGLHAQCWQTGESSQDQRQARWAGVLPTPRRDQASALLLHFPSGCFSEEASHPARPSPFPEMQTVRRAGPDPENASSLLFAHLPPGPWDGCGRSSDGSPPSHCRDGETETWRDREPEPCRAIPGLEPLGLGEGPGSRFVLSPAFALHELRSSPRGDLVPQPRKAKPLI